MATPRLVCRYPRRGERIAPNTLREFLMDPIPRRLRGPSDADRLNLCDLDETVWERFSDEVIGELAKRIVDRVAAHQVRKVFQHRHFPRPAPGIRLEDLQLENRTRRCLAKEGFEDNPELLGDHTIGQIMAIRAFGPRCLVDLLSALESNGSRGQLGGVAGTPGGELSEVLTEEARRMLALPSPGMVRPGDPRFADRIVAVDIEARSAKDLAERVIARTQDPPDTPYVVEQMRQLCDQIEGMPKLTLERELIEIFGSTTYERNRRILIGYYGWEDGRQHTLTEIGTQFGITRERVRQVCAKLTKKRKGIKKILAPVMDRALAMIERRLPCSVAELEAELATKSLTAVSLPLESIAKGAKLLGRAVAFKIVKVDGGKLAVRAQQIAAVAAAVDLAKKEVYFHGLATVDQIDRATSEKFPGISQPKLVRQILQLIDGFSWLDERSGWFRIKTIVKHGLPKAIDKILSVADDVTVTQMREAMGRNRRLWKEPPPANVLLEFCRQMPSVRVQGNRVIAETPRDWEEILTGVEATLVRVLKEHGPVMERGAMEDLCVAGGMNRFSFHAFVSWSPVIAQFGHSIYGLLGTEVTGVEIRALMAQRRAKRLTHRVLDDHGWTDDGKVWLAYRLSKAASTYAVITIPAALKKVVQGRFELLGTDGKPIGTLATKDGRAWGLGALMRQREAQVGDYVVVTLDLQQRTAVVTLGEDLLKE
ncbi:MAG: sigma factor-like helix-turn-helix DNA-binding protein [Thermoguttaceae bacterium]